MSIAVRLFLDLDLYLLAASLFHHRQGQRQVLEDRLDLIGPHGARKRHRQAVDRIAQRD